MITNNVNDYFTAVINAQNALASPKKRLIKAEITFLVNCAVFYYNGGDLKDLNALYNYVSERGVRSKNYFSVLRTHIASKQFIVSSREELVLPKMLKKRSGEEIYTMIKYVDEG